MAQSHFLLTSGSAQCSITDSQQSQDLPGDLMGDLRGIHISQIPNPQSPAVSSSLLMLELLSSAPFKLVKFDQFEVVWVFFATYSIRHYVFVICFGFFTGGR